MEKEKLTPPNASGSKLSKHESLKVCLGHVDYNRMPAEPGKAWNSIFEIPGLEKSGKNGIMDKRPGKAWNFFQPTKK